MYFCGSSRILRHFCCLSPCLLRCCLQQHTRARSYTQGQDKKTRRSNTGQPSTGSGHTAVGFMNKAEEASTATESRSVTGQAHKDLKPISFYIISFFKGENKALKWCYPIMRQQCPYWTPQGTKKSSARSGLLLELLTSLVLESPEHYRLLSILQVSLQNATVRP